MRNSVATKSFAFKSDSSPEGRIEGHASVFENVDNSGDRMMRGCFSKYLQKQMDDGLVKLAYNHKTVIGVAEEVTEDEHGLRVSGKISETSLGKDVKILTADGALRHMSIKFAYTKDGYVKNKFGGKDYTDVKLLDVSIVDWPDNEMANFSMKDSDSRLNDIYEMVLEIKEKLLPTGEEQHGEAAPQAEKPENDEGARGGDSEVEGKDGNKPVFGSLIEKIEQKTGELDQKKTAGALSWLTQLIENKL